MKFKTTQKAIKQGYNNVISVSYCALQRLLSCESEIAYTTRAEGWGADIYQFGNTAVVTGYAPFGNVCPGYETNQRYEQRAAKATEGTYDWQEKKNILSGLIEEFIQEVIKMDIVIKDGERLYLRAWEYNAARIMSELANIVKNHGGRVKPANTAIISDRSATEEAEPITVTHTGYISFALDETHYYYQVNDNPFFEFYYNKTPIKNGKCSKDAGVEADKKEWLFDCFFGSNCGQQDITEAANLIFNMLCNAPVSKIIRDKRKQRVANTYNDGWHFETVYAPERLEKVDF